MEYKGMEGESEPHNRIQEMARFNLETIRSLQPHGPYFIGGMCFGGLVAFEMAQQLIADGEDVAILGILDSTHAPNLSRPPMYPVFKITRFINQKILKQRFPIGMAPLRRAMKKFDPEDELGRRIYRIFTAHNDARVSYLTTAYPGRITLFNTPGRKGEFSGKQWSRVAGGDLEIVIVPGVHTGAREDAKEGEVPFVNDPNAEVLATKLLANLDKAL
jgi:thioesterase domain-containing protein